MGRKDVIYNIANGRKTTMDQSIIITRADLEYYTLYTKTSRPANNNKIKNGSISYRRHYFQGDI